MSDKIPSEIPKEIQVGDKINLNTGYSCDIGYCQKIENGIVYWTHSKDGDGRLYNSPMANYNITVVHTTQPLATDGREELEKENGELKDEVFKWWNIAMKTKEQLKSDEITALQSSLKEKDLIIHGLEEGSQQWEQEYKDCRKILQDIIDAEASQWRRTSLSNPSQLPLVLIAAKEFLKTYQHE